MVVLGLRTLFHNRPEVDVVGFAHDADEALAVCRERTPRVAVLDVALDGSAVDGFELCRRLRAQSAGRRGRLLHRRWRSSGWPSAPSPPGRRVSSPRATAGDLLKACCSPRAGAPTSRPRFAAQADGRDFEDLSPKQLGVLRLLAQGLERKQIAERMGIGEETVKSHLAEVRRKLGARTSAQAVAIGLINALFDYATEGCRAERARAGRPRGGCRPAAAARRGAGHGRARVPSSAAPATTTSSSRAAV